ncbi:MAG: hypothetical protein ABSH49_24790 [Bryobacteraceae bacterium]
MRKGTPKDEAEHRDPGAISVFEALKRGFPAEVPIQIPIRSTDFVALNCDRFLLELNRPIKWSDFPERVLKALRASSIRWEDLPQTLTARLRVFVDDWIDTGLTKEGAEDPRTRDLTRAPLACYAVQEFASQQKSWLQPAPGGLRLNLPGEGWEQLTDQVAKANRLFSLFLMCGWRSRLAKCRLPSCGRYFALNHWKRVYKRGPVCPTCTRIRSAQSAVLGTSKARKQAEGALYSLVARRFGRKTSRYVNWHQDPKFRSEIVDFLNKQIMRTDSLRRVYRRPLTGKWLSWSKNRDGIENAAKGVIRAES